MTNSLRAYRISAAEGASHIGLLLSVYDALAEDIQSAGNAAAKCDIPMRCRYTQHALLLLGHLESWVPLLDDAVLRDSLTCFYMYLRSELLRLQSSLQQEGFADLAMRVCETRAAWQTKQTKSSHSVDVPSSETRNPEPAAEESESHLCWSA
jgi:flagellin-specific chaperone FliS